MTQLRTAIVIGTVCLLTMSSAAPHVAGADTPICGQGPAATDAEVRAALFSVYFYSFYLDASWLPVEFQPMPLADAAAILCRDTGDAAASRRRRAVVKLAAAGLETPRKDAVIALGAPIEQITDALNALTATPGGIGSGAPSIGMDYSAREQVVYRVLGSASLFAQCETKPAATKVTPDFASRRTTVVVEMPVRRTLPALRAAMDPQNWDICGKPYFAAAHVPKTDAKPNSDGDVEADPAAPTPGTQWARPLFEHFLFGWKPLYFASFKNVLEIDSKLDGALPKFSFELDYATYGKACAPFCRDLVVEYDSGGTETSALADGWLKLTARKKIAFSSLWPFDTALQVVTTISLYAMGDTINEGICCSP